MKNYLKNFQNFENFEFIDLDVTKTLVNLLDLLGPGIFVIHCKQTHRSLLCYSDNAYTSLKSIFTKLQKGTFENKELVKDYKLYGKKEFIFGLLVWGFEWESEIQLKKEFERIKSSWSYPFY